MLSAIMGSEDNQSQKAERKNAMLNLNIKKKEILYKNTETELLSDFYSSSTSNEGFKFARIDSNFKLFLPYLKDGAIRLYLYYALAANNKTGESWHGVETVSESLRITDRSIVNWNKELEDLGLIYRSSRGRKSKSTYLLPLTGFSVKMSISKINQIFTELRLFDSNEMTKVFGKFRLLTKLYVKTDNKSDKTVSQIVCVGLEKSNYFEGHEINRTIIFLYYDEKVDGGILYSKVDSVVTEEKVVVVHEKNANIEFAGKKFECDTNYKCYYINQACKIDDKTVHEIITQLSGDIDTSGLPEVEM
jgi:hypothetical protein